MESLFFQLKVAEINDVNRLVEFVEKAGVSSLGLEESYDCFVLMENGDREVVACIGVEPVGKYGLLRSLVVSDKLKQAHILTLFQSIQTLSEQKGIHDLYLVTNREASVHFLELMGFVETDQQTIPQELLTLKHLSGSLEEDHVKIMVKSA